ncbi:cytochrome b562 [Marinomonas colpomeniae]|uniref:Cytochrome b562 n=1 Tax=Marinomonas colpomeniae TaxID=2774408 RepID=A0ABR8P145_9GAMM|nr:cytochrome b562 [Marinomonas colpomeniae]MBD5772016.1 hypothetical protein [Marinomonas colpomeniae]
MNKKFLAAAILSFTMSSGVFAHGHCDETELHGYMMNIKDELKLMSGDVKSGDNESAAIRVQTLISYFEKSSEVTPNKFMSEHYEGEQLKLQTAAYEKSIKKMIDTLSRLKMALIEDNTEEVKKIFGEIGTQRNTGHQTFKSNC